ncbi:NucA/NucB deoxyribonuclease domain-containing protein, partial [Streptomyces hirsutus]|uniref:NucA/NucB deoxyribonuclease domain-containing protein n=1 Tax=Streptomyces hirsutus TaxID=35620 RepID=UPI003B97370A
RHVRHPLSLVPFAEINSTEGEGLFQGTFASTQRSLKRVTIGALLFSLCAPMSVANADEAADTLTMESYVQPLNADPLTAADVAGANGIARLRAMQTDEALSAVLPHEVIGEARSAAPRATETSAQPPMPAPAAPEADGVNAAAISLPEPPHTMTLSECVGQLGTKQFYVKSRYAVCSGRQFGQIWYSNGRVVGKSHFNVVVIGTIPKNSRDMTATYHYTDFTATGTNAAPAMGITTSASIPKSWPSTAGILKGGTLPSTKKWAELVSGLTIKHTITALSGQPGTLGSTRMISAIYQPNIKLIAPPGWGAEPFTGGDIFMFPPRWDEAGYLPSHTAGGAAVFSILPTLTYSTAASAPEREVALHIKKAFTTPHLTMPPLATKRLAGQHTDEPLTRLYHDSERRNKNRSRALWNCVKHFRPNYPQNGKECDEFPFAATYQGAAASEHDPLQDARNFSVLPIDAESNGAGGILLGQFYDLNRLIDGPDDGFLVKIT